MSAYQWLWVFWCLQFFTIEIPAIIMNRRSDKAGGVRQHRTLTENVRLVFATGKDSTRARWRAGRRIVFIAGFGWLVLHFANAWSL